MSFVPLIGRPTHFKAKSYNSTACGYTGSFTKTDDTKAVTCLRCRRTAAFQVAKKARQERTRSHG